MYNPIEEGWQHSLREQQKLESYLDQKVADLASDFGGLKDIDLLFGLINCKFSIALIVMDHIGDLVRSEGAELAKKMTLEGAAILEDVIQTKVSRDQKAEFLENKGLAEARELFNQILLRGGAAYFDAEDRGKEISREFSRVLAKAIRKYCEPDDRYQNSIRPEELPNPLRQLTAALFPILAPENQADPPYGIEEDEEEEIVRSPRLNLPLSQAIHYFERELIPELEEKLTHSPGDRDLQSRIADLWARVREYKKLRFIPRATPLVAPHGYYTDGLTEYTADGEMLVPVDLPVEILSGKNQDRAMELIKGEFTRQIAGKGICLDLDREVKRLRNLKSGRRGSSRFPTSKLDTDWGFGRLKRQFPELRLVEDRKEIGRLIEAAKLQPFRPLRRIIERRLSGAGGHPPLIG